MLRIANISITDVALKALRAERARFRPRRDREVFGLIFMSSFVNPDGTTVDGFHPGYTVHSVALEGLGARWAMAEILDGPDFLFVPKFKWDPRAHYIVDLSSPAYRLFSIGPDSIP